MREIKVVFILFYKWSVVSLLFIKTRHIYKKWKCITVLTVFLLFVAWKIHFCWPQAKDQEDYLFKFLWNQTPNKTYPISPVISMGFPTLTDFGVVTDPSWWWKMTQFYNIWSYSISLRYNSIMGQGRQSNREMLSHSLKRLSVWLSFEILFLRQWKNWSLYLRTKLCDKNFLSLTNPSYPHMVGETILKI